MCISHIINSLNTDLGRGIAPSPPPKISPCSQLTQFITGTFHFRVQSSLFNVTLFGT
jgi:hypothetical protein